MQGLALGALLASRRSRTKDRIFSRRLGFDREGAMSTARKLVFAQNPSEGCTKLYLTVEHLILQEPWRRLFEPEMLTRVRTGSTSSLADAGSGPSGHMIALP
jgi:hypothetical protein